MRAFTLLLLCALAVLAGGWTRAANPAPPQCTFNDHWRHNTLTIWKPGKPRWPLYRRFCGPAEAIVYARGGPYRIKGGSCSHSDGLLGVEIGLLSSPPAAPRKALTIGFRPRATHPGTFKLEDRPDGGYVIAQIQAGGNRAQIQSGTVTVRKPMRSGTFAVFTSNRRRVTGTWTCG